jgi:acyl-CoA synthetase (AMP-forming)/AMP-acid ligase II
MFEDDTVAALLARGAGADPAISAPGHQAITYDQLRKLVDARISQLNSLRIGRNSRVALVLPNGPQTAAAFVVLAAGLTTAPLNPAYRAEEFEFYLTDLKPQAVVVQEGLPSAARDVAGKLGLLVIDLHVEPGAPVGAFSLKPASPLTARNVQAASNTGMAAAEDLALVLHTSGTTSRPKIVPLTQRNIASSARHIAATLELVPADVCLNIMPLFHIHGLVGAVLSSLSAGAQVSCAPDSSPVRFFGWLGDVKPTWYTAAPSLHRAILARAARHADVTAHHRLRFIRSGSAALRPELMESLEQTFRVPVLQTYGMTEAAHQVACNPLPPRVRKSGSVGPAAGPEIAIMDEEGRLLPSEVAGEVVIRGPNVTAGYEENPEANKEALIDGWFRTGDQGRLDSDGYLWLTGRFKELINRGGEKVSPLEIEAVLMNHSDVQQVVSFAVPDEVHGEEIAAAVVRREGSSLTDRELRRYAAVHLADFKVPRKILFVDEIPKGATGKLQRIGLAARLGLVTSSER